MSVLNKRLLKVQKRIVDKFSEANWLELGIVLDRELEIQNHSRLLQSLSWNDSDYPAHVLSMLSKWKREDTALIDTVEAYLTEVFDNADGESASSVASTTRRIVFSPTVFELPTLGTDKKLVPVMIPFALEFERVFSTIKLGAEKEGMQCLRAKDIWEHTAVIQDIFSLIFRSFIVICDLTKRNPNVFYEAGIAHTLGKHVIPITQNPEDVPFDLRHHRFIHYLDNDQGRSDLQQKLSQRISTLNAE